MAPTVLSTPPPVAAAPGAPPEPSPEAGPVLAGVIASSPALDAPPTMPAESNPPAPAPVAAAPPQAPPAAPPAAPSAAPSEAPSAAPAQRGAPTAQAVAAKAAALADRGREEAKKLWEEFQEQPKFLRWKVYVAASYALVLLLTVLIAWPRNAIDAYVVIQREYLSGEPIVYVRNDSKEAWQKITVRVNGEWEFSATSLDPEADLNLTVSKLVKKEPSGKVQRAPRTVEPKRVEIETSDGSYTWEAE